MTQVDLIKKFGLRIQGKLGQHLLIDPNVARKITGAIEPEKGEWILEIGPGLGALTESLLEAGSRVLAVEKDPRFVDALKQEWGLKYAGQLELIQADFLDLDLPAELKKRSKTPWKVISNLPYYVTAPLLFTIFEAGSLFSQAVFMMQREVAERITAKPGTREYGRLSVSVSYFSHPRHVMDVSPGCFTPQPEVKSSVMAFTFKSKKERLSPALEKEFLAFVKRGFSQRRKTLLGLLIGQRPAWTRPALEAAFTQCALARDIRAERLALDDFLKLFAALRP